MGKSKNKLLIILMVAVLAVTACGLLLSACAEEPVKVVLDANGGTFTGGGTTLEIGNLQPGSSLDLSLYAPTRSGYTLTQWTDSNQNVTMAGASYRVPLTARPGSTVRLTAQWTSDSGDGITGTDIFREIIGGLTNGDNLHSEYSTTLTVPDGDGGTIDYSIQYASNVKRGIINQGEYDYDLGLVIRNETENKGVAGIYITDEYGVPGGLYIDTNPDDETGSVFLLEDFNSDYLLALVEKLPTALPDAISGLLGGLSIDIFDVIFSTALQATGEITVDGNGNNIYTLSFNPTALLTLSDLLSALVGGFGIDLNPLFSYLGDVIPDSTFVLSAVKDSSGNLLSLGSSFTNHETGEVLYEIDGGTITCTDRNEDTLSLIPSKVQNYANTYSLGHIQLSAGVTLDTLDAAGGQVDIAALINTFVPGTLPEGVLMLDADLAYRLDLAIDLDIAQKPYSKGESEGNVKDESVIAIEIKDTKNNDEVIAGIYYKEGYLYVNIGQIVGGLTGSAGVWNGKGFAIPFDLPSLITAIKDVAVDAIDGFFGTDHGMITGETDLTKAEGAVVGLSLAQDGNVYISQDWGNLFITIFQVLKIEGASNWVNITQGEDYDSLDITIDKALIDSVLTAISGFGVDTSAIQIPDFGTGTISFKSGSDGLRDISVGLALKGLNLDIKFDTLELLKPIEKGDPSFAEYVNKVLGDKSQYTSNLNDLVVSTLSSGLKGSIDLDISFNKGTYNLGDLLAIFGLDLGDLKIEVEKDAKLDLSLNAGLYIDETNYANSAMYLQLEANNAFSLGNTGNIIDEGVILGVYLQDNKVILDASGLTILGIDLPVYKITPKKFDMAALIGSLLAMIPDSDLAIDLSGVIASLTPAEQAAAAALAGNGNVIRSSTRVNNNDLINLTVNNNLLRATATLTGVLSLLSSLGLNIDFDASQFLQGEALIDIKLEDGALTAQVTGDLLTPEEGGPSGLNATLTLDLADEWQIGGGVKTHIDSTITTALAQADWEDADDALLNGLLDQLFNSTLTLAVTLPAADTGIANLIGEVIGLIPNVDENIKTLLSSIDLGIGTDKANIALKIELWKKDNGVAPQIIKLGITYANQVIAEILLNEQDDLYINLGYFGLGKYVVTDSGLYTMLTDLLDTLSEDLSLGSLLGGLVDFSGNIAFKAYTVGEDVMLMWNKYGAASSVYYKVYSGNSADDTLLLFDTGAEQATGFTFDEATGIYTASVTAADAYFIQVYTKLAQVQGQSAVTEQVLFDALATPSAYQAAPASAGYQTIDAVTFTWQAQNPFGAAETYQLVDAGGNAVSDLAGATYDASTFTYTAVVDLTDKTGPYTIRVNGVDEYTNIVPQQGAVTVAGIEMSLSESTYTLTWRSVDGASRYVVTMTDSAGVQLWTSTVADGGTRYSNIMWGAQYANYTLTVEAYDQNGERIAAGSVSSSASGGIMDTVTTLLSALSIKGNLISLNVTRDILSELIASLTGGATITLVDAAITDLDIFKGSANLSIGVYEDASVDDVDGYKITGSLTLAPTQGVPAVSGNTIDYKKINLLYGAGLVESVTSILAGGLSVEAELNISLERGNYNVAEIIGPFLPDNIAEYLGDEFIWKVGETGTTEIALNLGVYAALDEEDVNNSGFMVQLSFPNGVSLSGTGEDGVVAGNGFVIKKGAVITIAVSKNILVVDLSAITILGIQLPVYKVDNFKMGEFVEGYLVQLERTVANMYNDGNGMLYLPEKSNVIVDADKVDFEIAFDYIGDDMEFDVVYGTKGGETAIIGANVTYNKATTTHTAKGIYSVVAAEGDYIAVYAKDTNGNRYDCLKLTATKSGESIVFTVPEVAAQSLATTGLTYDNYLTIDSSKLQLVITSQTIFSLLSLVADIPSSISSMDFKVTVGLGEQDTASDEKSIWVVADGTLGGKDVTLSLDAGIGLGGKIGEQTIAEYIAEYIDEYDNEQSADENDYPTKLIAGILDEVLTSTVTLSITADAAAEQGFDLLGVAKQLVGGLINFGDTTLDLVAEQNGEPVSIDLVLALDGAMNGANVDLNMISLKLNYVTTDKTTTLLGIYVQGGKLWLDLSGIGMGAVQVDASDVINKLTSYLGGLIDGIDIDLAGILDMIAAGGTYPYGQPVTQSLAEGDTAAGDTSTGVSEETANVIKALITLVSVENANIKLDVTRNIINELLSLVDAVSMSLNASASGYLDIFAGKAEIVATVYDSSAGSGDSGKLTLTLGLGISATPAAAAGELADRISGLTAVELDLGNMDVSVANLLNSLSAKLNLKVTTAELDQDGNAPTTNIWDLLGPILDSVLVLDNQNVINALEAIKDNGVDWTIDPTSIDLDLALASDIKLTGEEGSEVIDAKNSTIVVGIIANKPLVLGSATNNTPMLNEGEGIYLTIYGGSLYIDLSQLKLLDIQLPVLKVGTFEVMDYIAEVADIIQGGIDDMLGGLDDLTQTQSLAAVMALANGTQTENAKLELGSDLTLSVALSAITKILKDTSIINLTALDLPWEIVLTTATDGPGQLQLQLNNTAYDTTSEGVNLEASLTLAAAFKERDPKAADDLRNKLLAYVNGTGENDTVADRFADKSGDLIGEVINSVLSSRLTLELGASSNGGTFDIKYALNGILKLLDMEMEDIDPDLAFNLDTSEGVKYRLNLTLDGDSSDLSAINAYIGIEMASGDGITEEDWETAIGIYVTGGEIYLDLRAIRNGALGGGVLKVTNSAIMDLFETELNKLLGNINLDLNELLTLSYTPIQQGGDVAEVSTAPSLTVNEMPVGTLVSHLIKMVSLQNLGVALNAHTALLKALTSELFGTAIDFVQADGSLLLVDGKLNLNVYVGDAAFADGEEVTTDRINVYKLAAVLDISRATDISGKIEDVKSEPPTVLDLSNGATLADSLMGLLGNLSLDLNVDISLPGGVFGIGDLLNSFGLVQGGLTDANGLDLIFEPLYKDETNSTADGGMKLGLTLSLRLALDAETPANSLGELKLSFNEDMVMGIGEDGQDKVLFKAGTNFLTVIIDGTNLYVDLSDITLLGITMPKYHTANFNIATFVDYVLGKALDNTDIVIYGDHGKTETGGESGEQGEGDVTTVNLAEKDDQGNGTSLSANGAMFIGVTENDIRAMVSFTAVEAFLKLFGLNAELGNYDANIDLTISRDENNPDWMKLHFVGQLDDDMYYKDAVTEGTVSITNVELGGTPSWKDAVRAEADKIAAGAQDAGSMLIQGIVDQILNLSATLNVSLEEGSDTYISLASVLGYIFDQTGIDVDLSEIMLDLAGLNVAVKINLDIDSESRDNSAATIEIKDSGNNIKLIGIYLKGQDLVIDLSGISLGRFAVTQSAIPDLVYDIVFDLIGQIEKIDIDLDTIVDSLYDLVNEAFKPAEEGAVEGQNLAVPELNVTPGVALSGNGFALMENEQYVTVTDNGNGTTTLSWSVYPSATVYMLQLYNGYDNSKTNLLEGALEEDDDFVYTATEDGMFVVTSRVTSVTVSTEALNNVGWLADATSKYNGAEFPSYYVFVVRAGRSFNADTNTFTPITLGGQDVYASATNYTLLKTILGMVKIRNGAIEVDARAVMVDKLLRGVLGVSFDWAEANVNIDIVKGSASIGLDLSDGDPEQYLATEATALPDDYNADADTLTYTWYLTAEQAENLAYVNFYLREREGDTSTYGNVLELPSNMASELYEWTMPTAENSYTMTLVIKNVSGIEWLNAAHRANADGVTTTNLEMALAGKLPLRVTGYYDVNTVRLAGTLQLGANGEEGANAALNGGTNPIYVDGALNENVQIINLQNNASLLSSVKELLNGFKLEAELAIYVAEGSYDMGALIAEILSAAGVGLEGLDEVTSLYWDITSPFMLNIRLQLLIEYGTSDEDMRIALTLDTDGLYIDGDNLINPGTLIGLYYTDGKALLDLTNFKIAGITLPAYTIDIELFDLVDGMITDLINGLDISAVSGDGAQDDAAVDEGQTGDIAGMNLANGDDELTAIDAVVLGISSEEIALRASFSAVATLLSTALSGNETVATVANVLESLDLSLGASMKRDQDLTLTLSGMLNWAPLRTDTDASDEFAATTAPSSSVKYESYSTAGGETTLVYSFAPVAGASSYTALLTNADGSIRVEGTVANGKATFQNAALDYDIASSNSYTVTVTGNITSPVNMQLSLGTAQLLGADQDAIKGELDGMLGTEDSAGSVNFEERVNAYGDLLLTGLIDTLLNTRISLALNLALIKDQLPAGGTVSLSDIVLAIAGDIVVSAGLTLDDILGSVDVVFDMDVTTIILDVAMNMDLDNPWNTDLLVQLRSDIGGVQDVLLGLYVYDNLLTIDLRALGLRAYTLQNFDYIVNVQNMLKELLFGSEATGDSGLLGEYDIDLSETIDGLLNPEEEDVPPATGDPGTTDQPSANVPAGEEPAEVPAISITAKNDVTDPDNRTTTISWPAVEGVDHYEIKAVLQDGTSAFVEQNYAATATSYTYPMIAGVYDVTVEAYSFNRTVIASGTRQMNGAIASILSAVSLQNTIVKLKVKPQIINNLLAVIAPDISINAEPIDVSASVDIFNGDASADVNVNLKYEQPVGDTTFRLGAELSIKTADTLYITDNTGVGEINEVLAELGSDVDTINFGSNVNDAGVDAARITYAILDALNTTNISATLNVSFNKGTYDIGAMLAGMGLDVLDGVSLLWTFDEEQDIALTLNLGMYVDVTGFTGTGSKGTWFLLDIVAASDIKLGNMVVNNNNMGDRYTLPAGTSIISIYGKEEAGDSSGTVYIDLSNLNLLGLELPVISAQYKFTDMLINEFYDIISTIMDLNSYLEVTHSITVSDQGVPTALTFSWDEVTLGNTSVSPEVFYDVTVVGTMPNGMTSTIRTETIQEESTSFNYGDIEMFSQFDVTVVSYFLFNGERRVLGEYTTNVQLNNSNAIATASYVTPDDVYAEEDNAELARVNNVKWTWTAAGTAQISWDAYEGATAYRIEIRRASDGAALQSTGSFAVPAENTSWTPETTFFLAKDSFDATHPMMGGSGEQVWDYGYIAEVYAYTDESINEIAETDFNLAALAPYTPVAVGAANSFTDMSMWFAPKASEYGGATSTFHVGWGAVEGAANYSVLPYRINNEVSGGVMTTTYPVVGLTAEGGALTATNLMLEGDQLSFTYYNATYTREYFVEVVAYDKFGNMIARGEMTAAMGKLNDSDKTLLPVSTIALVLDSERFGLEVQLNAILAILEGVGVELPIDLRGFDVEAALGLDTTIGISGGNNIITIATDGEGEEDVDGFKLNGLADGNYTLTMVYTNSGDVERTDSLSFTVASGEYTITSGDYSITDGFVNYGMRRNGTYKITLGGAATAEATFVVSRTLNLGITGNVTVPVSGAENSDNNFSIGVTDQTSTSTIGITNDGKTLFCEQPRSSQRNLRRAQLLHPAS